jgi:DNA-binding SARP family transcriptional activator/tetratricopeptide (TPR) repeat protein
VTAGPGRPVLVRLCGELRVEVAGSVLEGRALASRKGRLLLALLAAERGRLVPIDRIADVLWSGDPPVAAAANVATLVSRLRAVLGDGVLSGSRSAYGLLPGGAWTTDVDVAAGLVDEASRRAGSGEPGLALAAAERALGLLGRSRGLDGVDAATADDDWAAQVRTEVRLLRRTATHLAVEAASRTGGHAQAEARAAAAVEADPLDESAARDLMRVLVASGHAARALAVHAELARVLRRELGADPARETRDLHLALLRGLPPPDPDPAAPDRSGSRTVPATAARRVDPLRGRERELAVLTDAWSVAVSGDPGLVVVTGPGGIGKSALLTALTSVVETTGGVVLAARCHASERSLLLQPVADALRTTLTGRAPAELATLLDGYADEWLGLLPELAAALPAGAWQAGPRAAGRPAQAERRAVFDAVAHVLDRLSRSHPVLLVLDDLQDAGLATVELLDHLPRRLGLVGARVLLAAATRTGEGAAAAGLAGAEVRLVELDRLPASAVQAMAAAAGQGTHGPDLMSRTRGHAFSVVEMLRALAAGESGIPGTLADAVLARIDRAGADAAATMQAAAVLGTQVEPQLLAGLLDVSELVAVRRCEALVQAALMERSELGYQFAGDLVQEVVRDALPHPVRRAHHRRAADLLAEQPEAMAPHAEAVEDWARAARGWWLAGQAATVRGAVGDAVALLDRALTAAERVPAPDLVARVLIARATAREALTDYPAALLDLDAALATARATGDRRLELAALRARGGDVPVALHHSSPSWGGFVRSGLRLAAELGDRAAEAELGARLAVLGTSSLRFDEALDFGRRALAAGRASGDPAALIAGLDGIKTVHAYLGDAGPLGAVLDELTPLARRRDDGKVVQWCLFESSFVAMAVGDTDSARRRIDAAIEVGREVGYPAYAPFFLAHRAWMARLGGELDEGLADGHAAVAEAATLDHPWWFAAASGLHAAGLLAAGRTDDAAAVAGAGWESVRGHGAEAYQLLSAAPLAAATGDPDVLTTALALLSGVSAPAGQAWVLGADAYLTVAETLRMAGRDEEAATTVAPLLAATAPDNWGPVHDAARRFSRAGRR